MMNRLKNTIHKSSSEPNLFSYLFNPFHIARRNIFTVIKRNAADFDGELLDVGCGGKPYKELFNNVSKYHGLDIDHPRNRERNIADDYYDGKTFPYADCCFNGILCSQVLEHVFEPDQFVSELFRVLKPGGRIVLTVPFVWDEHEQPWDYARYSSFGLKALFEKHGFIIQHQEKLGGGLPTLIQLFAGLLYKKVQRIHTNLICKLALGIIIFLPLNILASISSFKKKSNHDLYLDNLIIAIKK